MAEANNIGLPIVDAKLGRAIAKWFSGLRDKVENTSRAGWLLESLPVIMCRGAEIGIQNGLKIRCPSGREGSSPSLGTINKLALAKIFTKLRYNRRLLCFG